MSLQSMDKTSPNYLYCPKNSNMPLTSHFWQIAFWVYDVSRTHYVFYNDDVTAKTAVMLYSNKIQLQTGASSYEEAILTGSGVWSHIRIMVTSPSGTVSILQDDIALSVSGNLSYSVFGNSNMCLLRGGGTIADLRIKNGAADAAAWTYYLGNIPGGGDIFLPPG